MRISSLILLILGAVLALLGADSAVASSSPYPGYVSDVEAEKSERYVEIYFYGPALSHEQSLQELIFNPLSAEFKQKYQERFGPLDTESIQFQNQKSLTQFDENRGASPEVEAESNRRRIFAEYMTRRLIEYHFDNYMKTKPEMRPIMEVKEKIQNVQVEVTKDTKLNIKYDFAGNFIDLILDNPYCDSKVSLEMNPKSFGPSTPQESRLWLGKNLTQTVRVNSNVSATDGIVYADISKNFAKWYLGSFIGAQTAYKEGGSSVRETKYLVGFSHSY